MSRPFPVFAPTHQASPEAPGGPRRALVFGEDTRAFLAIIRSLGRRGWEVHAVAADLSSPALKSRYLGAAHRLTAYSASPEAWLGELRGLIEDHRIDLVIPCTDDNLLLLHAHRGDLGGVRLALPNEAAMGVFFDKGETRRLATRLGIPVAKGRDLAPGDTPGRLVEEIGLPLVLKPRTTFALGQVLAKNSVAIIRSRDALGEALGGDDRFGLVEAFYQGEGVGLSVLADRGAILQAFQHRRIEEASLSGGSSSRISEPVDPAMLAAVAALARETALHGPGMFEFRRDRRNGAWVLLEVNPRLWGSLPLALAAGADFPALLCDLYLAGTTAPSVDYPTGIVRRALVAEYYRIVGEYEAGPATVRRKLALTLGLAGMALKALSPRRWDSYAPDDPAPWRAERSGLARWVAEAAARRLPRGAANRRRALAAGANG